MTTTAPVAVPMATSVPSGLSEYIRSLVDNAPPLSPAQRDRLRVLLSSRRPAGREGAV